MISFYNVDPGFLDAIFEKNLHYYWITDYDCIPVTIKIPLVQYKEASK